MQATLPVRTIQTGWMLVAAIAMAVAIAVGAAFGLVNTQPAATVAGPVNPVVTERSLVDFRAGERNFSIQGSSDTSEPRPYVRSNQGPIAR